MGPRPLALTALTPVEEGLGFFEQNSLPGPTIEPRPSIAVQRRGSDGADRRKVRHKATSPPERRSYAILLVGLAGGR